MSYVEMAQGNPSVMDSLHIAQEKGDPEAIEAAQAAADKKYIVAPENALSGDLESSSDLGNALKIVSQIDDVVTEWANKQPKNTDTNGLGGISNLAKETYNLLQNWKDVSAEGAAEKEKLAGKLKEIRAVRDKIYNHQMRYSDI
jgi:hypothetical protein